MRFGKLAFAVAVFVVCVALNALAAPEPPWSTATNCSGSIAVTSTAQQLFASGVHHGFQIQNLSTDVLGFSEFTTTPVVGAAGTWSIAISGGSYNTPVTYGSGNAVFIVGATLGDKFTCAVW